MTQSEPAAGPLEAACTAELGSDPHTDCNLSLRDRSAICQPFLRLESQKLSLLNNVITTGF